MSDPQGKERATQHQTQHQQLLIAIIAVGTTLLAVFVSNSIFINNTLKANQASLDKQVIAIHNTLDAGLTELKVELKGLNERLSQNERYNDKKFEDLDQKQETLENRVSASDQNHIEHLVQHSDLSKP